MAQGLITNIGYPVANLTCHKFGFGEGNARALPLMGLKCVFEHNVSKHSLPKPASPQAKKSKLVVLRSLDGAWLR